MAWTAPMTAVANATFTAAQFNANVRDNLNETAPAKATAAGRIFVTTAVNQIAERQILESTVTTSETTASTTYVDLATVGPQVTITTDVRALVFLSAQISNTTADIATYASVAVTGATTDAAVDSRALHLRGIINGTQRAGIAHLFTALTAGSNVFTAKYRVVSNTGTYVNRTLVVIAL